MEDKPSFQKAKEVAKKRDPYLGIILEEMRDQRKILIEGNDVLERKIDRIDAKLETFKTEANEKFEMLFEDQDELKDGQKKLEGKTDIIEGGMKQLLSDNQEFFEELRNVKADVANLDRRVTENRV
jgi:SMC interacting uncharacterized protein involved in chromosome segregation